MPPIRGSSSEYTLLSELSTKISIAFRKARPERYYGGTYLGDWLYHIESLCISCGITWEAWSRLAVIQLRGAVRRWWESIGMADSTYAQGRCFFTRAAGWALAQGESMEFLTRYGHLSTFPDPIRIMITYVQRLNTRVIYRAMTRPRAAVARRPQEANLAEMVINLQCRLEDQEREMQNLRVQLAQKNQELPPPPTVPTQPAAPTMPAAQVVQSMVRQEPLFERFRRMKPLEFEGSTDPLEAEECLTSIQIILNFMDLTKQEKVFCTSYVMKKDARYWWETMQMRKNIAVVINSGDRPPMTVAKCVERALRAVYHLAQAK
ncbi:hypothetical protein TIFTF001_034350 [Ficus carica]|uniref:Retrotransposon gag domain-containing protein n=1 Tax=Ficus carica TaxID=3494 RepID=A0AA88E097_FICCA|nr:hypothetical protein TIFTF001_034350 [Ficus carica]